VHDWLRDKKAQEHRDKEADRRPNQAHAQFLQVLAERHRRGLKQIFVLKSRHRILGLVTNA
jgi:hypothetical protein